MQFLDDLCRSRLWIVGPDEIFPMSKSENHNFEIIILDFAKYLKSCFFSVVGMVEINRRPTSHKSIDYW